MLRTLPPVTSNTASRKNAGRSTRECRGGNRGRCLRRKDRPQARFGGPRRRHASAVNGQDSAGRDLGIRETGTRASSFAAESEGRDGYAGQRSRAGRAESEVRSFGTCSCRFQFSDGVVAWTQWSGDATSGGSSFVPAVRRIFESRFGVERIRAGNEFTSVARGLAPKSAAAGLR